MNDDRPSRAEGDRQDAETNRIAAEGNRMTAEDARVVTDKGRVEDEVSRAKHRRRLSVAQLVAFLLIVAACLVALYHYGNTQTALCDAAIEERLAIRGLVEGITELSEDLVSDGRGERAALEMVRDFQAEQLDTLSVPVCEEQ